jgi:hypothetical protein
MEIKSKQDQGFLSKYQVTWQCPINKSQVGNAERQVTQFHEEIKYKGKKRDEVKNLDR